MLAVYDHDFPDPCVLPTGEGYYAYATETDGRVGCLFSADLSTFEPRPDPCPTLPTWAVKGRSWAPDVSVVEHGALKARLYRMYLAMQANAQGTQHHIGVGVSVAPDGPFHFGNVPLVRDQIDPSLFTDDDGTEYLLTAGAHATAGFINLTRLAYHGMTADGPMIPILAASPHDGGVVEAPQMFKRDGTYILLFSTHSFESEDYCVEWASAPRVTGPFFRCGRILGSTLTVKGPGAIHVFRQLNGDQAAAFHGWPAWGVGYPDAYRRLYLSPLVWVDNFIPVVTDYWRDLDTQAYLAGVPPWTAPSSLPPTVYA